MQHDQNRRQRDIKPDMARPAEDEWERGDHGQGEPPKSAPGRGLQRIYKKERRAINAKQGDVLSQSSFRSFKFNSAAAGEQRGDDLVDLKIVINQQRHEGTEDQEKSDERAIERKRVEAIGKKSQR